MPLNQLNASDPFKQAASAFQNLKTCRLDVVFGGTSLTRDMLEMIIEDFSLASQDQATFNSWIKIDMDLEKALKTYKSTLAALLQGMTTSGAVAAEVQSETGTPGPAGFAPDLTANQL